MDVHLNLLHEPEVAYTTLGCGWEKVTMLVNLTLEVGIVVVVMVVGEE